MTKNRMKSISDLTEDHRIIWRSLDVLDEMSARTQNQQPIPEQDVLTLLRFLRVFADDHHQTKEESALFPVLMQTKANGRLRQMIFEHDQERSLVEGLEDSLRTRKGAEFVHFANRLAQLIRTHIQKEDTVLFPIAESCLSEQQDERVTAELQKFTVDSTLLDDLRRLEWAYLKRAA